MLKYFKYKEGEVNEIIFLRDFELSQVQEYQPEFNVFIDKKEIVLEDVKEQVETNKDEVVETMVKGGKQQSIISVNVSKLDLLLNLVGDIFLHSFTRILY